MKTILTQTILPLLLIAGLFACAAMNRENVGSQAPELLPAFEQAQKDEAALKAEVADAAAAIEAAKLTEDPADDEAAEARARELAPKLEALESQLRQLEVAFNQRQAEPFLGPLDAFIPGGKELITLGLIPLLGARGRRHYANTIRNASKGQVLTALGDILKAYGLQHSTPESAKAAASKPA